LAVNLAALLRQALNILWLRVAEVQGNILLAAAAQAAPDLEAHLLLQELHIPLPLERAGRRKIRLDPAIMVQTLRHFLFPLPVVAAAVILTLRGQVAALAVAAELTLEER